MSRLVLALVLAAAPAARTGDQVSLPVPPGTPAFGPASAPVTIQEFLDYQCPYCRRMQPVLERLLDAYKGRLRLVFRDLPLDIHNQAFSAAVAAHCAGEQGRFWEYHRALFLSPDLGEDSLQTVASSVKLDRVLFAACRSSGRYMAPLKRSVQDALSRGFYSTPTLVVNTTVVVGVARENSLRALIERALNDHGTSNIIAPIGLVEGAGPGEALFK